MQLSEVSVALLVLCLFTTFSASSKDQANINLKIDLSISCGSVITSAEINGREWTGDTNPRFASVLQIKGASRTSSAIQKLSSGDPAIHKTARISHSPFLYSFHLSPGQKILRLHFNPVSYKGFKRSKDLFIVEAGPFTLLSNFSASLTANALGMKTFTKEFYISIDKNQRLDVTFSPAISRSQDRTYAFINGIEIISVPTSLSYFQGGEPKPQVVGHKSLVYIDNTTALEMIGRVNVRRDLHSLNNEFDLFGMWATVPKQKVDDDLKSRTWERLVDVGFRYLVRIHFCNLQLKMAVSGHVMFKILINEMVADANFDIIKERDNSGFLWYRDYIVSMKGNKQDARRDLSISLQTNNDFLNGLEILKGFEIFKLSNPDNNLASPSPLPIARYSPTSNIKTLQSILGDKNAISTVAIIIISLVNIIVHKLGQVLDANHAEGEKKPSAVAQRHCHRFSLAEMQSATKNFSDALLIGRGGFGKVYKGLIHDGRETVAIKRLKFNSQQGQHEFWTEIETLSELRHINLVSLIGYCNESREMILVYEYMMHGTLADHLYKLEREDNNNLSSLTWKQRLNVCIGAGRGLEYLHTGYGVIHRDVKTSNILLDENFKARVSDFGLAKLEDRVNLQSHVSTIVKGTPGYLDPYYHSNRKLTRKSDTYSFGVVLLEVLCGRPAMDRRLGEEECCLSKWAQNIINIGEVNQIVDSCLIQEISPDSLKTFVGIAVSCLHEDPKRRPTMAQVVLQLEFALEKQEITKQDPKPSVADEIMLPVGMEQLTEAHTDVQTVIPPLIEQNKSKTVNAELPARNKDVKNIKTYKQLRLRPWDAFWNRVKPSKKKESGYTTLSEICEAGVKLRKFGLASIAAATDQFSDSSKIGSGGFGPVYKAVLPTGQIVVVKRLYLISMQGLDKIKSEVLLVPNLRHRNIIELLGYCIHGEETMLVYEFMANLSLDTYIYDETKSSLLHWTLRFKIIMGVARGITYLHEDSGKRIVHRDIIPSNILLDSQMNPRISGFGYALTFEDDHSQMLSNLAGTYGYMAPECCIERRVSAMSDVYSFGVIVLEIVAGIGIRFRLGISAYAWKLWHEGKMLDLVDESIQGAFSVDEALRCIQVGLLCTQRQPHHRPTMSSVLKMLLGEEFSMHEIVVEASSNGHNPENESEFMPYSATDSAATLKYDITQEK